MTVTDVLEYLAGGMTQEELLKEFPDLTSEDIRACLAFAADRVIPDSSHDPFELLSVPSAIMRIRDRDYLSYEKTGTEISLLVQIDGECAVSRPGKADGEIEGNGGLAATPFRVGESINVRHGFTSP